MGWGPKAPAPDPNIGEAAKATSEIGKEQWEWMRDVQYPRELAQTDKYLGLLDRQTAAAEDMQEYQLGLTKKHDQRYWDTVVPLQDKYAKEAFAYNAEAEGEKQKGYAWADIEQAVDGAMAGLGRNVARSGGSMRSGAALSALGDISSNAILAKATAGNLARRGAEDTGFARRSAAVDATSGLAGAGSTAAQLSMGAGGSAAGYGGAGTNATRGLAQNYFAGGNAATNSYNTSGNLGLGLYRGALDAYGQQMQMTGAVIGAAGKLGAAAISDRRLKKNVRRVGALESGLPVYVFQYTFEDDVPTWHMGVMADEAKLVFPEAVIHDDDLGYDRVDYSKLR